MTRWIVDPGLRNLDSVAWCREWLEGYDLIQLDWVRIDHGRGGYEGLYGRCWYPDDGKGFRLSCQAPGPFPMKQRTYLKPVYRMADGSWEAKPKGARVAQHWEAEGGREWLTIYRNIPIATQDEGVVWILGHEAFHFLRKTRQVDGRDVEWQADAFGCNLLERWRSGLTFGQLRLF
jgi:hypothetical protein